MTPSSGDTAWVMTSAALVLLMTPGLALFYGGMVRAKSVLNMMMMSFGALGLISVLWVLYGYTLAFGDDVGGGLLGNLDFAGLKGLMATAPLGGVEGEAAGIPPLAFVGFQGVFAIITVALITGAIADRAKFGSWMVFAGIWATVVYFPVAHWVFAFDGYTAEIGGWIANDLAAVDFAGGTAVHANAGAAGLALAILLGKRKGWRKDPMRPHNLPLRPARRGPAVVRLVRLQRRIGAGRQRLPRSRSSTPTRDRGGDARLAAGGEDPRRPPDDAGRGVRCGGRPGRDHPGCFVVARSARSSWALIAGRLLLAGRGLKFQFGFDDALDVVGVHLVGGVLGALLIGLLGTATVNAASVDGLFYGGGLDRCWASRLAAGASWRLLVRARLRPRPVIEQDLRASGSARPRSRAWTSTHAETAYDTRRVGRLGAQLHRPRSSVSKEG